MSKSLRFIELSSTEHIMYGDFGGSRMEMLDTSHSQEISINLYNNHAQMLKVEERNDFRNNFNFPKR